MRIFILIFSVLFLFSSCIVQDADECVNALDCPACNLCVDGICVSGEPVDNSQNQNDGISVSDNSNTQTDTVTSDESSTENDIEIADNKIDDGNTDNDQSQNDTDLIVDNSENPDDVVDTCGTETCSGHGTCKEVGGETVCECDEGYKGDDCSECTPGYHLEDVGDDENGSGERDCAKNVICTSDPCNHGTCVETEWSVTCTCNDGYQGRWCDECKAGYLLSTVDDVCKPDCATGDYGCTGSKECEVNSTTNEAGCVCKEGFSGTDCTVCDSATYCNSHGTCSASGGTPTCVCNEEYTGSDCSACAEDYIADGGICIEGCNASCGQAEGFINEESHGECQVSGGSAECQCDSGWKDPMIMILPMVPECSECVKGSPPPEYSTNGCPASCKDGDGVYELCGSHGDCYYEQTGSNKRYCECDGGYILDNGDKYTGTCQ